VYRNDDQFDASNVLFEQDRVLRYSKTDKTPAMRHIDYGLGAFSHAAFASFASRSEFDLAELYEVLVRSGRLLAHEVATRFYEVGSLDGLREFREFARQHPSGGDARRP
jgi:hypothetical protein